MTRYVPEPDPRRQKGADAMTFDEFHNALRVLLNIDYPEFADAIRALGERGDPPEPQWSRFKDNPHMWFIAAPTLQAEAIWEIVERRLAPEEAAGEKPGKVARVATSKY